MDVFTAIRERHSCRAFLERPVDRAEIEELLTLAGLAPSAINMQVWECTAVFGVELRRLGRALARAMKERFLTCGPENRLPLPPAQIERQVEAGRMMTPLLAEMGTDIRTFVNQGTLDFYGAPVGLVFYMDPAHPDRRLADVGILVGYLLLAARRMGLATCPLGLICNYADVVSDFLNVPEDKVLVLGVAVGYADPESPVNRLATGRAPLEDWVRWYGA